MQKAFWDLLEQQLEADPPQYTQVRKEPKSFFALEKRVKNFVIQNSLIIA